MSQTKAQLIEGLNINTSAPADALVIDSSGRLLVGISSSVDVASTAAAEFQVQTSGNITAAFHSIANAAGPAGILALGHGRGTASGVLQNDDVMGEIRFAGGDGTDLETQGAAIVAQVDGTPGSNDMPGRLVFKTTADGASSTTERLRIDSSGRVGIATTSPTFPLQVETSATGTTSGSNGVILVQSKASGRDAHIRFGDSVNATARVGYLSNSLYAWVNGAERLRIDTSGRVLVGTSSATLDSSQAVLQVSNSSGPLIVLGRNDTTVSSGNLIGDIKWYSNAGSANEEVARIRVDADAAQGSGDKPGRMEFHTTADGASSPTERMRINSSGNVGIGTTAPLRALTIAKTGSVISGTGNSFGFSINPQTNGYVYLDAVTGGSNNTSLSLRTYNNGTYTQAIQSISGNETTFETAGSERMRINSNGKLLVGHSSATDVAAIQSQLQVVGADAATGSIAIRRDQNASSGPLLVFGASRSTSRGGNTVVQSGDQLGAILFNGADGTDLATSGARIKVEVDGTPGSNDMPGRLVFETTADGSSSLTERMRIDQGGRVLVGDSLTTRTAGGVNCHMHVESTGANGSSLALIRNTNGATNPPYLFFGKTRSSSTGGTTAVQNGDLLGYLAWQGADGNDLDGTAAAIQAAVDGTPGSNDMPGRLEFQTTRDGNNSPTIAMGINRNGEVRIGHQNSDPVSTDHVHSIGDPNLDSVTTNVARLVMQERSGNWISFKDGGGAHYGTISRNPPGVTYGSNSDYRLKENVENFTNGITLVKQLRPVTFNWNESSGFDTTLTQRGFLAHEVQDVEPNAVVGDKDEMDRYGDCYDAEGRKTQVNVFEHQAKEGETWTFQSEDIRHQQLDPAKLVPLLTAALQEAIAKIETLETKVAALEAG